MILGISQGTVVPCDIGIAMFLYFSYIRKFTCFQLQVNLTFKDFKAQNMLKVICVPINYHYLSKTFFHVLSMLFIFFFLSKTCS